MKIKKTQDYESVDPPAPDPALQKEDVAMVTKIHWITAKGNHAEVKRRTDGRLVVYEVKKNVI